MSKQVRLEIPLYNKGKYLSKVWLKIVGNNTLAFADMECTIPVSSTGQKSVINLNVPNTMEKIEVSRLIGVGPCDYISLSWHWLDTNIVNYKFSTLKKLFVVFDDRQHEIPVVEGRPSKNDWIYYTSVINSRSLLFLKKWVFIVSILENSTLGTLYLSSDSAE